MPTKTPKHQNNWGLRSIVGGCVLVVLVIALYFLPSLFLRGYLEGFLTDYGMEAKGLEEVHFNVFNLGLETGPLTIVRQGNDVVDLDGLTLFLRLGPLTQQHIDVTGARLEGLEVAVIRDTNGKITLRDLPDLGSDNLDKEPLAWILGLTSLELVNATINLDFEQVQGPLVIRNLRVENLKTWTPETPGSLDVDATFAGGTIDGSMRVRPFTEVLDVAYDLEVEGLPLEAFDVGVTTSGILSVELDGDVQISEHVMVNVSGDVSLTQGTFDQGGQSVAFKEVNLELERASISTLVGRVHDAATSSDQVNISAAGTVDAKDITWSDGAQTAAGDTLELGITALNIVTSDGLFSYTLTAALEGQSLVIGSGETTLASIEDISTPSIIADQEGSILIEHLDLANLTALQAPQRGIALDQVTMGPIALDEKGDLSLGDIAFSGLEAALHLTDDGLVELALLPPSAEEDTDTGPLPAISLNSVSLIDEGLIAFSDETLATPQTFQLRIDQFEAGALDMAVPTNPTPVTLKASLQERTTLDLAGSTRPLAEFGPDFEITGTLKSLPLPVVSDYAANTIGVHLRAGRLDMDFSANAEAGQLEAQTDWLIQRIEIEELDDFDKGKLSEQADVPVDLAVDLLQDKDGNITLNIPISGALTDPNFDVSSAASKAIGNAISGAVVSTLKVLFPIVLLADIAKKDGGLKFEPVSFAALADTPEAASSTYLTSVGELMTQRPKMSLLLCGVAAHADLAALRMPAHHTALAQAREAAEPHLPVAVGLVGETDAPLHSTVIALRALEADDPMAAPATKEENALLEALADRRQQWARGALSNEFDIDDDRLFACRSKVVLEATGPPRVEISL